MSSDRHWFSFMLALILSCSVNVLHAKNLPYKAVNLGNWLVAEGWMQEPSHGIVNKDLLVSFFFSPKQ